MGTAVYTWWYMVIYFEYIRKSIIRVRVRHSSTQSQEGLYVYTSTPVDTTSSAYR